MRIHQSGEKRARRRFQIILGLSVLIPCALLGALAVHILRSREAQMLEMARSRTRATARMAVSAVEKAVAAGTGEILMGFMKVVLEPGPSLNETLSAYLADHPMSVAVFVFGREGKVSGRAVSGPGGEGKSAAAFRPGSPLLQRVYAAVRTRRREGRTDFSLHERAGDLDLLIIHTSLGKRPGAPPASLAVVLDWDWLKRNVVAPVLKRQAGGSGLTIRLSGKKAGTPAGASSASAPFSESVPLGAVEVGGVEAAIRRSRNRGRVLLGVGLALVYAVAAGGVSFSWRVFRREWALNRLKTDFMANVSHELRTPLSLIRMYAESLLLGRVSDETRRNEYHQIIVRETGRLTHLINNVLDFSEIESDRKKFEFRRASLAEVVRKVLADYGPHLEQAGKRLDARIADDATKALLDEGAVTQALINLLDNAAKFSPDPSEITVRVYADGGPAPGNLVLEVADQGKGIAPDQRARIFEPFYRVNPGIAPRGSGLGLAVVRHVAEAHGGSVRVEPVPGGGSRFILRLPREIEPAGGAARGEDA